MYHFEMQIGVLSDTHGLLRQETLEALQGSELIIHAGDVGRLDILDHLKAIAPVVAVRGNVDHGALAALPMTEVIACEGRHIYCLHIRDDLDLDPAAAGFDVVIFGHSHRSLIERRDDVLYLNPGELRTPPLFPSRYACPPRRTTAGKWRRGRSGDRSRDSRPSHLAIR